MTTDIHDAVRSLEASPEFTAFLAENPHHYLVHIFATAQASASSPELGYYGKESDRITVFRTSPIVRLPSEEVFKEEGSLRALDLAQVQIGLEGALEKAETYRMQGYPQHQAMKFICILQQLDVPLWNITIVTNTMNMINVKIDARTGDMVYRDMQNIMSIAK